LSSSRDPGLPPAAILAGGLATRLRPLTDDVPKAMIDVDGQPFVAHQLRLLRSRGIARVVLCLGYKGSMVESFVGDGTAFGLEVAYSHDGPRLLGTAGALKRALPLLGDAFFVLYGDSYLPCDYGSAWDTFRRSGRFALMTVFRNDGRWDTSNVEYRDGRIVAYSKSERTGRMHHIDYGLGVLSGPAFADVPADEPYDLARLYAGLLARGQLAAHEVGERFYEVGSFAGLEEMRALLRGGS
jgi:NDP-sugar pyrophosphorylase family protein